MCVVSVETGMRDANSGVAGASDKTPPPKNPAKSFTYRELCIATGMFNSANKIGEGGFGKVFKGRLETGEVSILRLCLSFSYF